MTRFARELPASGIRKFFDLANVIQSQGHTVHRLDIGRPVWNVPKGAIQLLSEAMQNGHYHYIANRGNSHLRTVLSEDLFKKTGKKFDTENEFIITTGASEGLAMCSLALLKEGDEMIIPEPAWPHYKATAILAGATPVTIDLSPANDFQLNPELVEKHITPKTKILVLTNPSNPTGAVQKRSVLEALAALAEKHGFYILADEVYDHFVYDETEFSSMAEIMKDSDKLIYLNSLSKTYSMTGWRIGYICSDAQVSDAMNRVHQYLTVCGVSTVQFAAAHLLENIDESNYVADMLGEFSKRRAVWISDSDKSNNFAYSSPQGAFYFFPEFDFKGMDSHKFCEYMLKEYHVSMVPGEVFGESFKNHVRISFSGSVDTQEQAKSIIMSTLAKSEVS
ncbi:pyridoxal phosphate-dependent aminotransferase [Maridesulfovibrio sp.]|uniref:pyridoxal phosphate-dependent aminotransferase n=1 Tax=Maridesulfovibrio sp. TaxID=2795000 RepID=UPI002A18D7CD|nr:pyridoxal phosphate-dependent aminotransferase [Maridesulfovibrio sp.]